MKVRNYLPSLRRYIARVLAVITCIPFVAYAWHTCYVAIDGVPAHPGDPTAGVYANSVVGFLVGAFLAVVWLDGLATWSGRDKMVRVSKFCLCLAIAAFGLGFISGRFYIIETAVFLDNGYQEFRSYGGFSRLMGENGWRR